MSDQLNPNQNSETTLTPKQKEILDFIELFAADHGYAPSQQEIARNFGFKSLGTVQNYLVRLERQGALQKSWNARRGMKVVKREATSISPVGADPAQPGGHGADQARPGWHSNGAVSLPLLGRVAAGRPIEAIQSDETFDVPASMVRGPDNFVLKVVGDSMIDEGILSGDYVVIKKQLTAANGQTVVALVGNEATIKKYYRRSGRVELHPANPAYQPLIIESMVESAEFKIEGVLLGVIRRLG